LLPVISIDLTYLPTCTHVTMSTLYPPSTVLCTHHVDFPKHGEPPKPRGGDTTHHFEKRRNRYYVGLPGSPNTINSSRVNTVVPRTAQASNLYTGVPDSAKFVSIAEAYESLKAEPRVIDFNSSVANPGSTYSLRYPTDTEHGADDEGTAKKTLELPFVLYIHPTGEVEVLGEGTEAVDPNPDVLGCEWDSPDYHDKWTQVINRIDGENNNWRQ
jgi:hypothetical protein